MCVSDDESAESHLLQEKEMKEGHENPAEQHDRVVLVLVLVLLVLFMHHTQDSAWYRE